MWSPQKNIVYMLKTCQSRGGCGQALFIHQPYEEQLGEAGVI